MVIIWTSFQNCFQLIEAAGGVVNHQNKILFIFRRDKWDLPKGKIDPGETPEITALREVEEETGLVNLSIKTKLPPTWHIYQSKYGKTSNQWILKKTYWFEMEHTGSGKIVPQSEEYIELIKWNEKGKTKKILNNAYRSLNSIIQNYC